jgi:hypothetical protein
MAKAPGDFSGGLDQARQLLADSRLADPGEHFPYKHREVRALLDKNPPAGPRGPKDDSFRTSDFMSDKIADATRDFIDAQSAVLKDVRDPYARLQYKGATDFLVASRRAHRVGRVREDGSPKLTITGRDESAPARAGARAITASGFFLASFIDELDATNIGLDLTLTTHKWFLISDAATPNFDTNTAYASLSGNEVSGTGWAAGGVLFSAAAAGATSLAPTLTISPAGTIMWDMNDISVAATSLTNAMAAVAYADALTTPVADALILLVDFVTPATTNNGTFGIQWASAGVATLDMTP